MMCPVCERAVRAADQECACGELLTAWANIRRTGQVLRQRGLARAGAGDHVGAVLSFLQAALSNPLDEVSLVDAARALVHLERTDDAVAWLRVAASRPAARAAATELLGALEARAEPQSEPQPEPQATPRRPLMARGVLQRSARWGRWRSGKKLDGLWAVVLRLEQEERDWTAPAPWLPDLLADARGYGAIHYALGLGAWQRGDPEAERCFRDCLDTDPPVLNPALYYLSLHADADRPAALAFLRHKYAAADVARCLQALPPNRPATP